VFTDGSIPRFRLSQRRPGSGWHNALIITEYLAREIGKPFAVILGILCALFGGYSISSSLADPANGLLPASIIFELAGLKLLISQDVLIPVALYFAVLLSFSRLHADREIAAMQALGASPMRAVRAVLGIAVVTALAVCVMAMLARPWAYRTSHDITWLGATKVDLDAMQAGTFYASQDGSRVIFLTHRARHGGQANDVFVRRNVGNHIEVIFAQGATPLPNRDATGQREVYLSDAHIYEIDPANPQNDQLVDAAGLKLDPSGEQGSAPGYSPVAASTLHLARSSAPRDIAEWQWRLSTPVSTILLALMGIPLSRTQARQGRFARFGPAILIYAGYYLLCTTTRTWVEHGTISPFPGIWWGPIALALLLVAGFNERAIRFRLARLTAPRLAAP
jgi:lipopolysaccharide export system permease protein